MRCRILETGELVTLRPTGIWDVVPGEIAPLTLSKRWTYGSTQHVSGTLGPARLDAAALGLTPLRLTPFGLWDPAEEFWSEPGEPIAAWAKPIIRAGPRPQFEMEQVIPGDDPEQPWSDPIGLANDKRDAGDTRGAFEILNKLCREDLRCLDAHAHLGSLSFDAHPGLALRHYEVGVRIAERSFPEGTGCTGVLPWGLIDNRPFLRCLHGYGLCLWRLERFEEAAAVFDRMLWLNPTDNQGVRAIVGLARARQPWSDFLGSSFWKSTSADRECRPRRSKKQPPRHKRRQKPGVTRPDDRSENRRHKKRPA